MYQNVLVVDDGMGGLNLCYTSSGLRIVLEKSIGTIDYTTGAVKLDVNPYNYAQSIDYYAKPNTSDVNVNESKFLKIDYSKIIVLVNPIA
jgi:hypothetical protein